MTLYHWTMEILFALKFLWFISLFIICFFHYVDQIVHSKENVENQMTLQILSTKHLNTDNQLSSGLFDVKKRKKTKNNSYNTTSKTYYIKKTYYILFASSHISSLYYCFFPEFNPSFITSDQVTTALAALWCPVITSFLVYFKGLSVCHWVIVPDCSSSLPLAGSLLTCDDDALNAPSGILRPLETPSPTGAPSGQSESR